MTSPAADISLYQYLQGIDPDLASLTVSSPTLKTTVETLIDLLIEQQIRAIVWLKLPRSTAWTAEIDRYLNQGEAEKVYLCTIREDKSSPPSLSSPSLIPVSLEASSHLKRECFVIVLSPLFSCFLLAYQQPTLSETEVNWKLVYSFQVSRTLEVLERVKQSITITDTTPEEILASSPLSFTPSLDTSLIQQLLFKQIQQTERIQGKVRRQEQSTETINTLTDSLNYSHEVLSNLTQELKLPLTNIKTALRLLDSMQSKREQRQRYIELLQRECDRQSLLLTGLQEFIQFTQNLPAQVNANLKLEDLIPGIVSTYQPLAEEKGILLGYTIPAGFPPVACPESWLRQILQNLLNNSLKFTPAQGRIHVQAFLKENNVEITISDTGIGIEQSELPRIFQSFYKGRNTISNSGSSAGLGLTLAKYLTTRCGGSIAVNSKVGKGTTFLVTLPIILLEGK